MQIDNSRLINYDTFSVVPSITPKNDVPLNYMIKTIHRLLIFTSMKHSPLFLKLLALALHSLDTLSDVRIKAFTLLF
jgi:hypothetical protein